MRIPISTEQKSEVAQTPFPTSACCGCFAGVGILMYALVTIVFNKPGSAHLRDDPPPAHTVAVSDEQALAQVDYGPGAIPSSTLAKYSALLDRLENTFPENRHQITLTMLAAYPQLKVNDPTLKSILEYGNSLEKSIPDEMKKSVKAQKKRQKKR